MNKWYEVWAKLSDKFAPQKEIGIAENHWWTHYRVLTRIDLKRA